MSPDEDAALLNPAFPQEDWGCLAQQALEKLLKAAIVHTNREPPLSHELSSLAALAEVSLNPQLLALQPFAVKARYSAEDTPLPGDRGELPGELVALLDDLERRLKA